MPRTFDDIKEHVEKVRGAVSSVQIDIMDGLFVSEKSWPFFDDKNLKERLPYADEIIYSADLMIINTAEQVQGWALRGFRQIIVHIGSTKDVGGIMDVARSNTMEVGIAFTASTTEEMVSPWVEQADFIQCMGIERIGYQGEPFNEKVLPLIQNLREKYPSAVLQVDGGVNLITAPKLAEAGASRLVVGSALWKSGNPKGVLEQLQGIHV